MIIRNKVKYLHPPHGAKQIEGMILCRCLSSLKYKEGKTSAAPAENGRRMRNEENAKRY